ncbi:MAG TPA: M23 family metallopeptidase, partial [Actinomycetota bacterium]|nr:M23 family metallopeptidase [Actinomycetota bacterium]
VDDGMTFPVLRTNWYSVINFRDDWHAPRMRLVGGKWRQVGIHEGNDIFAEPGTPIVAMMPGRVEQIGWTFYSGWRVGVRGIDSNYWFYAHMRRFAPGVGIGTPVEPGDTLGEVGNTGYGLEPGHHDEFPPHLHVGIQRPDGAWVNPYPLLKKLYAASLRA